MKRVRLSHSLQSTEGTSMDGRPEMVPKEALEREVEQLREEDRRRLAEREKEGDLVRDEERLQEVREQYLRAMREEQECQLRKEYERPEGYRCG